jgi:hypothetical protein
LRGAHRLLESKVLLGKISECKIGEFLEARESAACYFNERVDGMIKKSIKRVETFPIRIHYTDE